MSPRSYENSWEIWLLLKLTLSYVRSYYNPSSYFFSLLTLWWGSEYRVRVKVGTTKVELNQLWTGVNYPPTLPISNLCLYQNLAVTQCGAEYWADLKLWRLTLSWTLSWGLGVVNVHCCHSLNIDKKNLKPINPTYTTLDPDSSCLLLNESLQHYRWDLNNGPFNMTGFLRTPSTMIGDRLDTSFLSDIGCYTLSLDSQNLCHQFLMNNTWEIWLLFKIAFSYVRFTYYHSPN